MMDPVRREQQMQEVRNAILVFPLAYIWVTLPQENANLSSLF